MSGVGGHISHLWEDPDLTFGELKEIIIAAATGQLQEVTEKLDGIALSFTFDASRRELRAARNAGDIKSGGMTAAALAAKFANRGSLSEAFESGFRTLRQAIEALDPATVVETFGRTGDVWYSVEVIYSGNTNVIDYGSNHLVFHKSPVYRVSIGELRSVSSKGVETLSDNVEAMQEALAESDWTLRGPVSVQLKKVTDGSISKKAIAQVAAAQASVGASDGDTILDYLQAKARVDLSKLGIPQHHLNGVAARAVQASGAPSLTHLKKILTKTTYAQVRELALSKDTLRRYIEPIESAITGFAIELLSGLSSALIHDKDAEIQRLRGELEKATSAIQASGDANAMEVFQRQIKKLGSAGNIDAALEGIVFAWNGKAYKLTGFFAALNQILGVFRYGRNKPAVQSETLLRNYVGMVLHRAF